MEPIIELSTTVPAARLPQRLSPLARALQSFAGQRELTHAAGWSLIAAVVARGANLFAFVFCARILTQAEFGEIGIIQSTVGMFAPMAGLGLAMTATKFLAEFRDSDPLRAGRILGLTLATAAVAGSVMTIALIAFAPWIAQRGLLTPGLEPRLVSASGLLFLGVIESAQTGALTGLSAFSTLARIGAWSGVVAIPTIAILAWMNGAAGAILGLTISLGLSCLLNANALRTECRRFGIRATLKGTLLERNLLLRFSLPSYVSGLLIAPVAWLANAFLVQMPGGLKQMAVFGAADRYRFLLIFLPLAVSRIAVPSLSRLHATGDTFGYRRALRWNLAIALIATGIPAVVCILFSAPLMLLFGPEFGMGWPVLSLLALSAIPTVLNTQLGAAMLSEGRAWGRAAADGALALTFLGLSWWAVPAWGAMGLAAAFASAYSVASFFLAVALWSSKRAAS